MNGEHAAGDDAPADHQGGDPAAGADALQRQVCGNLKQKIAEEENSRAEAVDRVAETELRLHLQGGEADVDAVEIGDNVEEKEKRKQAPAKFFEERRRIDGSFGRERKMFKNLARDLFGGQFDGKREGIARFLEVGKLSRENWLFRRSGRGVGAGAGR